MFKRTLLMRIRVLGCSGGIGAGARTSAMLVDNDVLIDAGTGIGDLDLEDIDTIRHVFLTHSHLDHVAGLPLLVDRVFDEDVATPLTVYARKETLAAVQAHLFNDVIWPDFGKLPSKEKPMLRYQVCSPGDTITIGHRDFQAVDVIHSVPSLGFTVQNSGGAFAVSGDTKTNETLWPVLNACDELKILVIEVSFPDEMASLAQESGHYTPKSLIADLRRLRHEPEIWLTGMKPGEEQRIFRQVVTLAPDKNIQMLSRGTVLTV
ncbi:MAG: 3',5'-cyclic-nucleotide phosphodiesterase [Gammaproteobacteria bacterium]|nr:3',5'-cyclic-nucleotide phosphodiesterase [Gammaproteobacteria bacterium]MDH3820344.1 3',5'-cyclic-nucleotide phosphodiesterase [Gammaproteobacteria bacterium]MDH3983599.1 3',5'-cyclic-nucleotide phosphodiesterase [Gammaproteobacteria bacterium]